MPVFMHREVEGEDASQTCTAELEQVDAMKVHGWKLGKSSEDFNENRAPAEPAPAEPAKPTGKAPAKAPAK